MNKYLQELIELSKNDQAMDSYNPQLEAADKKIAKIQKKIDAAQTDLDDLRGSLSHRDDHGTDDTAPTFKMISALIV